MLSYKTCFDPYTKNFKKITLDANHSNKLTKAILKLIRCDEVRLGRKLNENEIGSYKKLFMRVAGEVVLEQFLKINFVDYENISSNQPFISTKFKKNIDVTTFSYGIFPLVYKRTFRKTIFICMISKTEYYICGLGTPTTIGGYSKIDLVLSENLKNSGRAGFFGFYHLSPLTDNLGDFVKLIG
jgi:hypothetical protein